VRWEVLCECGTRTTVSATSLLAGTSKSCGCTRGGHNRTHGESGHSFYSVEYNAWLHMRQRCTNPNYYRVLGQPGAGKMHQRPSVHPVCTFELPASWDGSQFPL
jgi:hypothetical protein